MEQHQEQKYIAGVDEAGRGPLAGPVFAAAVILNPKRPIRGLKDSKLLSEKKREYLYRLIQERALAWSVAHASVEEIDALNILQASLLAMQRAIATLSIQPDLTLIDGNRCPSNLVGEVRAVIAGDRTVPAISAASIIAKVTRDREMRIWHEQFPQYGFDQHKGYATPEHLDALKTHGPTLIHRRSFEPVAVLI